MSAADETVRIHLRYPRDGRWAELPLSIPRNVPVVELLGDFLDLAELPDSAGWSVGLAGGEQCGEKTVAELEFPDTLVLDDGAPQEVHLSRPASFDGTSLNGAAPVDHRDAHNGHEPDRHTSTAQQLRSSSSRQRSQSRSRRHPQSTSQQPPPSTSPQRPPSASRRRLNGSASRPVRARSLQLLPNRPSVGARMCEVAAALWASPESGNAAELGANDPQLFTRATRRPLRVRVREAWRGTDYERLLEATTKEPYPARCQTIAVISPKGGVGKTAITALLGSLIAYIRRDRTIAVDTNPDFGSLGRRLVPEHRVFIDDLLGGPLASERTSPMELAVHLGHGPDGLMVAPAPTDRERAQRLDEAQYRTLFCKLSELAEVLVLDCGTGLDSPAARAALGTADQLVLVTDGEPDTASLITDSACKSLLEDLDVPVFLVANKLTARSRVDLSAFEREMAFARGIVDVPHDQAGADSLQRSRFSWAHRAPDPWRVPLRELATLVTLAWPTRKQARG